VKSRLRILAAVSCLAWPFALCAQSVLEYAEKATGSAADAGPNSIGGCAMDSGLVTCLSRLHPRTALVTGIVIALLFLRFIMRRRSR
jgi:hypothetical protein